jgi:molybdopterin synthase catalytic subunit/molybdopterin converting factor small subunit
MREASATMTKNVQLRVLFFGIVKDITGRAEERLEMGGPPLAGAVLDQYCSRYPKLREISGSLVLAVNSKFAKRNTALADGDEVAFLPPVSGGASQWTHAKELPDGSFFGLTREPIDARELTARLQRGRDGAVVTFEGVARDNTGGRATLFLEYEAYEPMALETMVEIGDSIVTLFAIDRIAMVHRLGRLDIGEASVVIVVTSAHRKPAFDASLEAINRLKKRVPIWKKEHFADGEVWVEGDWDSSVLR